VLLLFLGVSVAETVPLEAFEVGLVELVVRLEALKSTCVSGED
jgi:hypothetical protein